MMKKKIILISVSVLLFAGLMLGGFLIYNKRKMTRALDLPMIYIETANQENIVSKENYLNCKITISNIDEKYQIDSESAKVKGRGNSTWAMYDKKPYKIKFDKKVDLFGNGKAKEWTLIANHGDQSLMRNYLAYSVANKFENFKYTTSTQFVELYVNSEYVGVYLLCEQVEVGKNRVEIEDDLASVDTGYLLELDDKIVNEGQEGKDWFTSNGKTFAIKSPDTDDDGFTVEHINFIKNYMDECFSVLESGDYLSVCNLIDVESFAESYILNELFKTTDVFMSSFYMHKNAGGKLSAGPAWDYDLSSGNCMYDNHSTETDYLYAKNNILFNMLLEYEEFDLLVGEKLKQYKTVIKETIEQKIQFVKNNYARSMERNFDRWKILGVYVWGNSDEVAKIKTWEGQVDYLKEWLDDSFEYLIKTYI